MKTNILNNINYKEAIEIENFSISNKDIEIIKNSKRYVEFYENVEKMILDKLSLMRWSIAEDYKESFSKSHE